MHMKINIKTMIAISLHLFTLSIADIVDYTRENYLLLENGKAAIYSDFGRIFHVTNLTYFEELIGETQFKLENDIFHSEISTEIARKKNKLNSSEFDITIIKTLLAQLKLVRKKRGINEIGTIWKWISGSPDHDDIVLTNNKINELIESNNKQFVTNSDMFNAIHKLTQSMRNIENDIQPRLAKERNKMIIMELQNVIQTITLAKSGILNPTILNLDDIKQITQHEHDYVTITDLIDVSEFKIIQNKDVIVILIKYPIVNKTCKLFETRAISHKDGKLLIDKEIAKCQNTYINVKKCKQELKYMYCMLGNYTSCLSKILNNKKAKCNKIKEKNLDLEIIKDGVILASGNHTVNDTIICGTYLISFEKEINIDGKTYENPTSEIQAFLKTYTIDKYEVENYLETLNDDLKLDNVNIIQSLQNKISNNAVITSLTFFVITIAVAMFIRTLLKKRSSNANQVDEIRLSKLMERVEELTEEAGRSS